MTYEPPKIAERAELGGPVIGGPTLGSVQPPSPAWRRNDGDQADDA